jgi:hypothetical protein
MSEEQQIEEILLEAKAYGVGYEVSAWAEMLTLVNPKLNKVTAHQRGYDEWVKYYE